MAQSPETLDSEVRGELFAIQGVFKLNVRKEIDCEKIFTYLTHD